MGSANFITLRITNGPVQAAPRERVKVFDENGGTIGRAEGNDWVLPDPTRHLSGRHAALFFDQGTFQLLDTSSNGIFVNGETEPLGAERVAVLKEGDRLAMGDYEFAVSLPTARAAPTPSLRPAAAPAVALPGQWPGAGEGEGLDPLALLRSPAPAASLPAVAAVGAIEEEDDGHAAVVAPGFSFPQADWPCHGESGAESLDPLALLGGGDAAPAFSKVVRPAGGRLAAHGTQRDDAPILSSHCPAPRTVDLVPEDWDPLEDTQPMPASTVSPCPVPPDGCGSSGGELRPDAPAPVPPAAAAGQAVAEGRALRAFFSGAGLDPSLADKLDPVQTLELAGRLLREAVGGLRELLLARASVKSGFRMGMTWIAPKNNNPLKFCAGGVDEALGTLLMYRGKAYLPAVEAVQHSVEDLKDHEMALLAGLRSGFDGLVHCFDPALVEADFERQGRRSLLGSRGAACWELYRSRFAATSKAADEKFHELFGGAFAAGYQDHAQQLAVLRPPHSEENRHGLG